MKRSRDFASSRITLEDGRVLTKCDQCREMWSERNARGVEGSPSCEGCKVELMPENNEAAEVYQIVQGQVLVRHNGQHDVVTDLNHLAVKTVMDLYQIRDQRLVFEKVMRCFYYFLEEKRDEG